MSHTPSSPGLSAGVDADDAERDERGLSPDLQQHIGHRLRALYDGVVNEPIPDRLMALLNKLDGGAESDGNTSGGERNR